MLNKEFISLSLVKKLIQYVEENSIACCRCCRRRCADHSPCGDGEWGCEVGRFMKLILLSSIIACLRRPIRVIMLATKSQKNNEIPYFLTQRNWECQAGMECIMHPGKELGQCVDIDECTASILYLTPCVVLLKYCRRAHHQTP